jgi:MOSC domain-containing protein YiiM
MTDTLRGRVVSVNVGGLRQLTSHGRPVPTGIFKQPVAGPVHVGRLGLAGDLQADLTVHGGPEKAVYAYPIEHYEWWRREMPELTFEPATFGENLTVTGLPFENEIHSGDRFRVGTAELVVTGPRLPCFKLGLRMQRPDMVKRFLASHRTGYYFSVAVEGAVQTGDDIVLLERLDGSVSVWEIVRLYAFDTDDAAAVRRLVSAPGIPEGWRTWFAERVAGT